MNLEFHTLPKSKKEAQAKGFNRYCDGSTCANGHAEDRYIKGGCVVCCKQRARRGDKARKQKLKEQNAEKRQAITRTCKRKLCSVEFVPQNRIDQVFCSPRCADIQGKADWKKRNADRYRESESARRKRKYQLDSEYRNKQKSRSSNTWHSLDPEEKYRRRKKWRVSRDPESVREYMRNYHRDRSRHDVNFRVINSLRSRVRCAIKAARGTKSVTTADLVGCSIQELRAHLEANFKEGMSWDNYGEWHIDHIRPCSSFSNLGTDEQEQKECFHYTNLQPLWRLDNLRKRSSYESRQTKRLHRDIRKSTPKMEGREALHAFH